MTKDLFISPTFAFVTKNSQLPHCKENILAVVYSRFYNLMVGRKVEQKLIKQKSGIFFVACSLSCGVVTYTVYSTSMSDVIISNILIDHCQKYE